MKQYFFYDSDDSGFEDYDIAGAEYIQLLRLCFKYCTTVSFRTCNYGYIKSVVPEGMQDCRIAVTNGVFAMYNHYGQETVVMSDIAGKYEIHHYRLTEKVKNILLDSIESIFSWICADGLSNPEDLAFFRSDGSAFFSSITHEGECTVYPREDEDITELLSNPHWIKMIV